MKKSPRKKKIVKQHKMRANKYHTKIKIDATFEEAIRMAVKGNFKPDKK